MKVCLGSGEVLMADILDDVILGFDFVKLHSVVVNMLARSL